jgi:hypothetical protein
MRPMTSFAGFPLFLSILLLNLRIAIIYEQQAGCIEAPASERADDCSKMAELLQDYRDMIDKDLFAIVDEGRKSRRELLSRDFAPVVLVLEYIALFLGLKDLVDGTSNTLATRVALKTQYAHLKAADSNTK